MLIQAKTLKTSLETLIEQHGMVEVLDRLADINQTRPVANASQITRLLEEAIELTLGNQPLTYPSTLRLSAHGEAHPST